MVNSISTPVTVKFFPDQTGSKQMLSILFVALIVGVSVVLAGIGKDDLSDVYIVLGYPDKSQDYVVQDDTWLSPSFLVLPNSAKYENQINDLSDERLQILREKLWRVMFGQSEPNLNTVISLLKIATGLAQDAERVFDLLVPNVFVYHEADYKENPEFYSVKIEAKSGSVEDVSKYLKDIADHRQTIADQINTEYRVTSPFGLGEDIVLSILNHNNNQDLLRKHFEAYLTLKTRNELMKAERELSNIVKNAQGEPHLYDHIQVKVLTRSQDGTLKQTFSSFAVPWEYGGCSEYPSVTQLRAEIVDRLGNNNYYYVPAIDPIFRSPHQKSKLADEEREEIKCKRACVDHLDSGLGFEIAVACGQMGCVPLAMTISDSSVHKNMDVSLRRLPEFLFAAVITAKVNKIQGIERILAEIVVFSHTSSLPYLRLMLKAAAEGKWYPMHLLQYRDLMEYEQVFASILLTVEAMTRGEVDMERTEAIRPNWDQQLMALIE